MNTFLNHLQQSPYCYRNYPITSTAQGRVACPCGWIGEVFQQKERCYGCLQYRITVDDTGYCRWCREEGQDDLLSSPKPLTVESDPFQAWVYQVSPGQIVLLTQAEIARRGLPPASGRLLVPTLLDTYRRKAVQAGLQLTKEGDVWHVMTLSGYRHHLYSDQELLSYLQGYLEGEG